MTSSPWPDRIEITAVRQFGAGAYDVSGEIIDMTSTGAAGARPLEIGVVDFNGRWLISGVSVTPAPPAGLNLAAELAARLPLSDMTSRDKCAILLAQITDFQSCAAAGFAVTKSDPSQCRTPDGRAFVGEISGD